MPSLGSYTVQRAGVYKHLQKHSRWVDGVVSILMSDVVEGETFSSDVVEPQTEAPPLCSHPSGPCDSFSPFNIQVGYGIISKSS